MVHGTRSRPRRMMGIRLGVTMGFALALVGALVGTAAGAPDNTPFQKVVVVNPPESPIPVVGTVSVANQPANQNVTVTNFPATQTVTGSVAVTNLPAAQVATKRFSQFVSMGPGFVDAVTVDLGQTINVTTFVIAQGDDDNFTVDLDDFELVTNHEGNLLESFPTAFPVHSVYLRCENLVLDCHMRLTVIGF